MKKALFNLVTLAVLSFISTDGLMQAKAQEPSYDSTVTASQERKLEARTLLTVNWKKSLRIVNPMAYGLNCPACLDPDWTKNPALLEPLAKITGGGRPIIRLHGWGMVTQGSGECWLNKDATWNADKIKRALTPLIRSGYRLMIDIPSGPGGEKDPLDEESMAPLGAALVKIVNVDLGLGVKYWELPNEREHILSADKMASLLAHASAAMKSVDPTILVGGPATEGISVDYVAALIHQDPSSVDFVTVHTYGGDGKQPTQVSYHSAIEAVNDVHKLRQRLTAESAGKYLPILVDEYNIGWDANPSIFDNRGAVYFSIIQTGVVDAGGDATAIWDVSPPHDMSIVDREGRLTESAHLFPLMNQYFYGNQVETASADPATLRIFAVKSKSFRSVLVSNLADQSKSMAFKVQGWKPKIVDEYQISDLGYTVKTGQRWNEIGISALPKNSVTVLVAR